MLQHTHYNYNLACALMKVTSDLRVLYLNYFLMIDFRESCLTNCRLFTYPAATLPSQTRPKSTSQLRPPNLSVPPPLVKFLPSALSPHLDESSTKVGIPGLIYSCILTAEHSA